MDHGNPAWDDGEVFFCPDEHITLLPTDAGPSNGAAWKVGDRGRL